MDVGVAVSLCVALCVALCAPLCAVSLCLRVCESVSLCVCVCRDCRRRHLAPWPTMLFHTDPFGEDGPLTMFFQSPPSRTMWVCGRLCHRYEGYAFHLPLHPSSKTRSPSVAARAKVLPKPLPFSNAFRRSPQSARSIQVSSGASPSFRASSRP